jgi:hypothetical protein
VGARGLTGHEVEHPRITPVFLVEDRHVTLNPFVFAKIPGERLGAFVNSFSSDDEAKRRIQDALGAALKPYYRAASDA